MFPVSTREFSSVSSVSERLPLTSNITLTLAKFVNDAGVKHFLVDDASVLSYITDL